MKTIVVGKSTKHNACPIVLPCPTSMVCIEIATKDDLIMGCSEGFKFGGETWTGVVINVNGSNCERGKTGQSKLYQSSLQKGKVR